MLPVRLELSFFFKLITLDTFYFLFKSLELDVFELILFIRVLLHSDFTSSSLLRKRTAFNTE
jgi:hypothetical protein